MLLSRLRYTHEKCFRLQFAVANDTVAGALSLLVTRKKRKAVMLELEAEILRGDHHQ